MKKVAIILFMFLYGVALSKENGAFVGIKLSNGITRIKYNVTFFDINSRFTDKQYHVGAYLNYGGTIKNFSIYSGIGYNLYHYQYLYLGFITINGLPVIGMKSEEIKLNVINIPVNIDYNLNVYRQKLFVVFGIGTELCFTFKGNVKKVDEYSTQYFNNRNPISFAITAKTGLLYAINKRLDCYAYFDFSHHVTPYMPLKKGADPHYISYAKMYPYNLLGSIGLNIKFYKKSKNKEEDK